MIFLGSLKTEDYVGFISKLISKRNLDSFSDDVIFFCDSASIHTTPYFY